jgi:DNA polymerase-3 subunit alpha
MVEGARNANDRRVGQASLFGAAEETSAALGDGIDPARAFGRADRLKAEYEVLGFYLSGHPLEERAGMLALLSSTNTRALQELPGGSEVTLGGLVVALRESTTRTGKKMARFRLEDLHGGVNVTCFPRTLERYRSLLVEDAFLICRGKLEERNAEDAGASVGLLLDEVLQLEEALQSFRGGLIIHLRACDDVLLPQVSELVRSHKGSSRLFFEIEGADGRLRRVRSSERHSVRISTELARGLESILGPGRAKLARL